MNVAEYFDIASDTRLSAVLRDLADADARDESINGIANEAAPKVANAILTDDKKAGAVACCLTECATQETLVGFIRAVMSCDKDAVFAIAQKMTGDAIWQDAMEDAQRFIDSLDKP